MPIYEYQCNDCKAEFEVLTTSAASAATIVCDRCKSANVKKIMSGGFTPVSRSSTPACGTSGCAPRRGFT